MNLGLKKYIYHYMQNCLQAGIGYVNPKTEEKSDNPADNLYFVILLYQQIGKEGFNLSCTYSKYDRASRFEFGYGIRINYAIKMDLPNYGKIVVHHADGSESMYQSKEDDTYICYEDYSQIKLENGIYYLYDKYGNKMKLRSRNSYDTVCINYPQSIEYANGTKLLFHCTRFSWNDTERIEAIESNKENASVEFQYKDESTDIVQSICIYKWGKLYHKIDFEYNQNYLSKVIHYENILQANGEFELVEQYTCEYQFNLDSENNIRIKNAKEKIYVTYLFNSSNKNLKQILTSREEITSNNSIKVNLSRNENEEYCEKYVPKITNETYGTYEKYYYKILPEGLSSADIYIQEESKLSYVVNENYEVVKYYYNNNELFAKSLPIYCKEEKFTNLIQNGYFTNGLMYWTKSGEGNMIVTSELPNQYRKHNKEILGTYSLELRCQSDSKSVKATQEVKVEYLPDEELVFMFWSCLAQDFISVEKESYVMLHFFQDNIFIETMKIIVPISQSYEFNPYRIKKDYSFNKIKVEVVVEGNQGYHFGGFGLQYCNFGVEFQYDQYGNVTKQITGSNETKIEYNAANLPSKVITSKGNDEVIMQYDEKQNVTSISISNKMTILNTYDDKNNLTERKINTIDGNISFEQTFNSQNQVITQKDHDEFSTTYTYDTSEFSRLNEITFPDNIRQKYSYNNQGLLKKFIIEHTPNQDYMTYNYNLSNQLAKADCNNQQQIINNK